MRLAIQNSIPAYRRRSSAAAPLNTRMTSLMGLGDSITVGQNCGTPGWDPNSGVWNDATHSFFNQLIAAYGFSSNDNKALRGHGIATCAKEAVADVSYGLSRRSYVVFGGYNDYRNLGLSTQLANRINDGYRSICALQSLKNWKCGDQYSLRSNASHFNTTFFNPINSRTNATTGHFIAQKTSGGTGAWIEYTFSGDGVVVGLGTNYSIESSGVWYDILDIKIDGNIVDTIDPARDTGIPFGWEVFYVPIYRMYTGFGPGAHTVRIQTQTNRNNAFQVDGIGEVEETKDTIRPCILMHTLKMTASGYALQSPTLNKGSDASVAQVNGEIDNVAAEFNNYYNNTFAVFPGNDVCNPATDFHADQIHPKREGHDNLATGLIALIS